MKAIYENRIYNVVDADVEIILEDKLGKQFAVDFSDEHLIVDPTDAEIADAHNLAEWYGVDSEAAKRLRAMLRGETSLDQWQQWRDQHRSAS